MYERERETERAGERKVLTHQPSRAQFRPINSQIVSIVQFCWFTRCVRPPKPPGTTNKWQPTTTTTTTTRKKRMHNLLTFAYFAAGNRFGWITVKAFLTEVTMASGCCVPTIQANSTRYTARQLVQFHVEAAAASVPIAVAGCK